MFNKKIISFDIGNENIKLLEGKQIGSNILIENYGLVKTPENSIKDGNIIDMNTLVNVVNGFLDKSKFKGKKAIITLDYPTIISREIILPLAKEEDLDEMVNYEIDEYLPINLDDYIIDYKTREKFDDDGTTKLKLLVAAMPKKIVEGMFRLLEEVDLHPLALDISSNSLSKLLSKRLNINNERIDYNGTIAFIDIGYNTLNLSIIDEGKSKFNRIISLGSKDINVAIANSFNLTLSEAKEKKEDFDLNSNENLDSYSLMKDIIQDVLNQWIKEIEKIFKYYTSRKRGNKVDRIYLFGGGSKLIGIEQYFSDTLGIETIRIKKVNCVKYGKKIEGLDESFYLNNIGSIIRL